MQKIDLVKLDKITSDIIETLEEEMPDDKSGLLCAQNRNSPFRQLVGLLEMEMDSIRIMYSDLPLPNYVKGVEDTDEPEKATELPKQVEPSHQSEPGIQKITPRPVSDRALETVTPSEQPAQPKSAPVQPQTTVETAVTANKIMLQPPLPANHGSHTAKFLLAAGVFILILLTGLILLRKESTQQQPTKVVMNWSDVEKGKTHSSDFKDKVTPQSQKQARSFYTLGNKELGRKNLRAAREYFRTAVSLDPASAEYMDAFRQTDYMLRKKNATSQTP
ncbi:MAG: hypothetical protein CVV42_06655 [Candidatus Riflebacteria bacterium HGW-Riflebacteria-2]|jgi:hypothetical protein|nr:MAG: hypothetical protein CVV42_06655 [Candidatus Riflebacteria bacterium HGW-Riflebacteria-2]